MPELQQRRGPGAGAAQRVPHQASPRPSTSPSTSSSWRTSRSPSARCCGSCRARPRCRTCWSTSRRPAWRRRCEEKLFQPGQEVKKDFYAELPIKIQLTGSYHEFGAFVSGIAALPRIVTLHDIQITPIDKDSGGYDQLQLDLTAKTYRYLDDDEVAAAEAEKRKADAGEAARQREQR